MKDQNIPLQDLEPTVWIILLCLGEDLMVDRGITC